MYIKESRYPYRRSGRRRSSLGRILLLLLVDALGLFMLFEFWSSPETSIGVLSTPLPAPTPTRSAASYVAEGTDAYFGGMMDAALASYRQALDLDPTQLELYVAMGRILVYRGAPERAVQLARTALLYDEAYAPAWALLCLAYDWLDLPLEAVAFCERAIALDPTSAEAYAYLAEAYVDAGNWFAANDAIATALRLNENSADVLRNQGYVLEVQGNYSAAIQAYRQALQRQPFLAHLYIAIGRNQHVLGNFSQAQESYQAATEVDPENLIALERAGLLHLLQGDYGPAQLYFQRALEIDPTYSRALARLGTLHFQRRNYEDAIPILENAIRYGQLESRRRTVMFVITEEPQGGPFAAPTGRTVARGEFAFPDDRRSPLRAMLQGTPGQEAVRGHIRLDPLDGRYRLQLTGLPPAAPGQVYVGWFRPLLAPERTTIHTPPFRPDAEGGVQLQDVTGPVRGVPIETYYTLSLSYYFLGRCAEARPYITIALRLDPQDANALQTQRLCAGQ